MTQQQGAERHHFGPSWPEVSGYGVQPHQAFFECVPTLADMYPPKQSSLPAVDTDETSDDKPKNNIALYDVLYACVAIDNE